MIVLQKQMSVLAAVILRIVIFFSQKVERNETSYGSIMIPKPNPDKSLEMLDHFFLTTDMDTAEIQPDVRFNSLIYGAQS